MQLFMRMTISMGAVHVGPPTTLTGGFGNFTNGMWFSVLKPMTMDSISVYLQRFGELPSSHLSKAAVIRHRATAVLN